MTEAGLDDRTPDRRTPADLAVEGLLALPRIVQLVMALLRDPRVPVRPKVVAGAVVVYVISPIDVLPDSIPFIGRLDDVVLVMAAFELLVDAAPEGVVEELWQGSEDALEVVYGLSRFMAGMMPKPVRRLMRHSETP